VVATKFSTLTRQLEEEWFVVAAVLGLIDCTLKNRSDSGDTILKVSPSWTEKGHDKYCVPLKQISETLVLPLDGLNDFQVGLMPDHRRFGPGELQVVIEGGRLEIAVVGLHQQ